mmetsp:Transcript_12676/g.25735  ORF Transcript_12676/g.25735 Transcript_12676/m.25735 type:complete len:524 (-) Transcript_12676:1450-3021(-)
MGESGAVFRGSTPAVGSFSVEEKIGENSSGNSGHGESLKIGMGVDHWSERRGGSSMVTTATTTAAAEAVQRYFDGPANTGREQGYQAKEPRQAIQRTAGAAAATAVVVEEVVVAVAASVASSAAPPVMLLEPAVLEMWVPLDRVGMIIGTKGQMIRSIQEQTGAEILVHNDHVSLNGEKRITMTGDEEQVARARKLVLDILKKPKPQIPSSPPMPFYFPYGASLQYSGRVPNGVYGGGVLGPEGTGTQSRTVYVPNSCVGIVIGKKGETIRDLQQRSNAHIKVTPDREASSDATERLITLSGTPAAIDLAHRLLIEVVSEGLKRMNGRNGTGEGMMATSPSNGFQGISVTIDVPNDKVGLIIGKQGATIRELQARSGTTITVAKKEETDQEKNLRPITVTGQAHLVEVAKYLIAGKMASSAAFPPAPLASFPSPYYSFGYPPGIYQAYELPYQYDFSSGVHPENGGMIYPMYNFGYVDVPRAPASVNVDEFQGFKYDNYPLSDHLTGQQVMDGVRQIPSPETT